MNYTNRINRLTHTLQLLSKGNGVSTPSLVEFFGEGVTKKMVQTDFKEYLLPLFVDEKIYYDYADRVYRAKNNFLVKTLFSAEELAIISILKNKADSTHKRIPLSRIVASKPVSSIKAS